jgi:hypothetical protein
MRFINRKTYDNSNENYKDLFENRNVNGIAHYSTPNFKYPSPQDMSQLLIEEHTWGFSDRYYKLSIRYYGTPQYWWVIALFNKTPTENMIQLGDTIYIPKPIQAVLNVLGA